MTGVRADVEDAISHTLPTDLGDVIEANALSCTLPCRAGFYAEQHE